MIREVLDTNVVVSALLFHGQASHLVALWQARRFVPLDLPSLRSFHGIGIIPVANSLSILERTSP